MDNSRIGIATGNSNYLTHQLLYAIIDIQKLIPYYQGGHETVYGAEDLVREGLASVGSLPVTEKCYPQDAYYKKTGNVCISQPLSPYSWGDRYDLVCGNPRFYNNQYFIAIDPHGKQFYVFPSVGNENKVTLSWDGVKLTFEDDDETPFDVDVAHCVGLFIKHKIARLVDHDLAESDSYMRDFLRARGLLYADSRERTRFVFNATSPAASDKCANAIGICTDAGGTCPDDTVPVEDTVEFCAFGDSGEEATIANTAAVANLVKSLEPDFVLQLGDIVYPSGQQVGIQDLLLKYYGLYIPDSFLWTPGNHDVVSDNGDALEALFTWQAELNSGKRYFSYTPERGHLTLWVINSETPLDQDMWDWLEAGLGTSSNWNVVAFHKPPYSSDVNHYPGDTNMRKPFKDWGASLLLCAHGHNYERIEVDGLPIIIAGLGGALKRGFHSPAVDGSQFRYNDFYGALWVTARDEQLQTTFYNTKGEIVDSLALERVVVAV